MKRLIIVISVILLAVFISSLSVTVSFSNSSTALELSAVDWEKQGDKVCSTSAPSCS